MHIEYVMHIEYIRCILNIKYMKKMHPLPQTMLCSFVPCLCREILFYSHRYLRT